MDYEKKYKDALERAKELIAKWTGKNKDFYIEDYAYIFPELRESEDERIRKALISYLKSDFISPFTYCGVTSEMMLAWLEKQKEQKPAEWNDYKDKIHTPYCSSEPEWSEEDEKMLSYFDRLLEFAYNNDPHNLGALSMDGKMWLKSLRPQKKEDL